MTTLLHTFCGNAVLEVVENGGQGRNRTADARLFRAGLGDGHLVDSALLRSIRCTGFSAAYWNHNGTKNFRLAGIASVPFTCLYFPVN